MDTKFKNSPQLNLKSNASDIKYDIIKKDKIIMSSRVCDNCGHKKDTYGGKTCSHGHFLCHSCASGHVHCTLCGHTLR